MFSSTAKFTKSEREVVEKMMKDIYGQFTTKAAKGRNPVRTMLFAYACVLVASYASSAAATGASR